MKKTLSSILIVIIMLSMVVIAGDSMTLGNIDSTWGSVDQGVGASPGATCLRYSDGPSGANASPNNFDGGITMKTNDPSIQNGDNTNWNQVRYGRPSGKSGCGSDTSTYYFGRQSGLAFNGVDAVVYTPPEEPTDYGVLEEFVLGKMCHVNNPISANNAFEWTTANLTISDVDCGPNGIVVDKDGNPVPEGKVDLTYTFSVQLDETTNSGTCRYPSVTLCADAVIPGQASGNNLYCQYENNTVDSLVAFIGFTPVGLDDSCVGQTFNPDNTMGIFISQEGSINCACVWAAITNITPSAVQMNYFEAEGGVEEIVISWQTAFETDNLGFNIYRSESMLREGAVQLNDALIVSLVPPGSTYGADYLFVDTTAKPYTTYFYWLEDFDVNGEVTSHGPVRAEWVD